MGRENTKPETGYPDEPFWRRLMSRPGLNKMGSQVQFCFILKLQNGYEFPTRFLR